MDGFDGEDGLDSLVPGPAGPAGAAATTFESLTGSVLITYYYTPGTSGPLNPSLGTLTVSSPTQPKSMLFLCRVRLATTDRLTMVGVMRLHGLYNGDR